MYPGSVAIQLAPREIKSGGFLGFDDTICRELLYPMLRTLVASAVLMAITIMLLHATHHGAHARSATHCGFWTEIEAGLSCRSGRGLLATSFQMQPTSLTIDR